MREITVGYFHYGKTDISRFLTSLAAVYPDAQVVNCAIACIPAYAMAARAQAYAQLRKEVRGDLILCDTDMEALKPVDVFPLDIGLTKSEQATPLMPFNGGMIFAGDTEAASKFLDEVRWCANIVPQDFGERMWYVDQLALGYVAKGNPAVKVFGPEYNYVPKFDGDKPDVYFVHYKGARKSWR